MPALKSQLFLLDFVWTRAVRTSFLCPDDKSLVICLPILVMTVGEALMGPELKGHSCVAGGSMPHYAVFPKCLLIPSCYLYLHPSTLSLQSTGKQHVPRTC